jgi:hypothetical protein
MKLYTVTDTERKDIIKYILDLREHRYKKLQEKYPDYLLNFRNRYNIEDNSLVPFFDIVCESLLHKDGCGYFDITEFTFQANCFAKTIFHRKQWTDWLQATDDFLYFVWDEWMKRQPVDEFTQLEKIANQMINSADDLFQYHYMFIYNDQYKWITDADITELFDELVRLGIWTVEENGLYKVYDSTEIEDADTNIKHNYYSGKISKIDELYLRSMFNTKLLPVLQQVNSKFNFIPSHGLGKFDGLWSQHKFGKNTWFIPQFLLFYNKPCIIKDMEI